MRRNRRGVDGLEDRTDDAEIGGEKDAEIWRDEIWRDEDAEIWRDEDAEIRRDVCRDVGFFVRHRERFLRHGRGGGGGARRHASRGDAAARESRGGGGEGEVSTRGVMRRPSRRQRRWRRREARDRAAGASSASSSPRRRSCCPGRFARGSDPRVPSKPRRRRRENARGRERDALVDDCFASRFRRAVRRMRDDGRRVVVVGRL